MARVQTKLLGLKNLSFTTCRLAIGVFDEAPRGHPAHDRNDYCGGGREQSLVLPGVPGRLPELITSSDCRRLAAQAAT